MSNPMRDVRRADHRYLPDILARQRCLAISEGAAVGDGRLITGVTTSVNAGHYWVATEPLVGCIGVVRCVPVWSDWHAGNWGMIDSLFVDEAYRRQGVATTLIDHLRQTCAYPRGLFLYVRKDNEIARACYRKLGFDESHYITMEQDCTP